MSASSARGATSTFRSLPSTQALAAALGFALVVGGGAAHPEVWLPAHGFKWMATTLALFAGGWVFFAGGWVLVAARKAWW